MKIILTHEVSGLGGAGEVVEVKDGYARNFLVPRGFAIRWTKGGQKDVDAIRRARKVHQIQTLEAANEFKAKLEGLQVKLAVRSGDAGRLFGSVTQADVVEAVKAAGGRLWTSAPSRSARRSRPWAPTRSRSSCTPTSRPTSTSPSSRPEPSRFA